MRSQGMNEILLLILDVLWYDFELILFDDLLIGTEFGFVFLATLDQLDASNRTI